jgi:RHS repeat-associated protein
VEAAYEYGASGELLRISGNAIAFDNPFRFSTKYFDEETELLYYGLRYYSPSLGRFISRDPIGEAGGQNLYSMVGNNAVNSIDYLGMDRFGNYGGYSNENYNPRDKSDGTNTEQKDTEDLVNITERSIERTEEFIKTAAEYGKTSQEAIQMLLEILSHQKASAAAKAALHNFLKAMSDGYQSLENAGKSSSSSDGGDYPKGEEVSYGTFGELEILGIEEGPIFDIPEMRKIPYILLERIRRFTIEQFQRNNGVDPNAYSRVATSYGSRAYAETGARILSRENWQALGYMAAYTSTPFAIYGLHAGYTALTPLQRSIFLKALNAGISLIPNSPEFPTVPLDPPPPVTDPAGNKPPPVPTGPAKQ